MELNEQLNRIAERIVADGTQSESRALEAMADAAAGLNPGAAAALADWNGSEIARLRAFGIVHGVLMRELPSTAQAQLLTRLPAIAPALVPAETQAVSASPAIRTHRLARAVRPLSWSRIRA